MKIFGKRCLKDKDIENIYRIGNWEGNLMDMFIKKGKLCDISKFAKN